MPAQAHCDLVKGPLATAVHQVLQSNNVKLVLPVEAHRERVEADLMFERYIYEVITNISSTEALIEGHAH